MINSVQIKYINLSEKSKIVDYTNNIKFSLYTILITCWLATISNSKDRV